MNSLPNEVLFRIFSYVDDQRDRCRLAKASKRLYLVYVTTKTASFDEAAHLTPSGLNAFLMRRATKLESLSIANCAWINLPSSCTRSGWTSLRRLDLRGSTCVPSKWLRTLFAGLERVESLAIDLEPSIISREVLQSIPASLKSLTVVIGKASIRKFYHWGGDWRELMLRPFYDIRLESFHAFFVLSHSSTELTGLREIRHFPYERDAGLASYSFCSRAHRVAFDDPTRSFADGVRNLFFPSWGRPEGESSFRHLTVLRLSSCKLTDEHLLRLSPLEHLLELDLSYNDQLSRNGFFNFLLEKGFGSMKNLRLAGNWRIFWDEEFYSQGLTTIAESMPLLEYLDVSGIYNLPVSLNLDDHHRVGSCIRALPRLRKLHLFVEFFLRSKHCPFEREMDSDFESVVQSNPALSHLCIDSGSSFPAPRKGSHFSLYGVSFWRNLTCLHILSSSNIVNVLNGLDFIAERCVCLREFALGGKQTNVERLLSRCLTKFNRLQKFGFESPISVSPLFFESLACLKELRYCRVDLSHKRPSFTSDLIQRIVDNAPQLIAFHLFCHSNPYVRGRCSAMIRSRGRESLHVFIGTHSSWKSSHHLKQWISGDNLESWWEDVAYHNAF
ncbi:uncharacterized protein [Oscarella lobularis]|uniref:uncharacterized protein isoform X2 n=1 Tax=Oscarella lobularis TaxID=121494 RepID=UPI0033135F36